MVYLQNLKQQLAQAAEALAGAAYNKADVSLLQQQINDLLPIVQQMANSQPAFQIQQVNLNLLAVPTPFSTGYLHELLDQFVVCADANNWN